MILVTGGTGLVGSHLLRALAEQDSRPIRAVYRNEDSIQITKKVFSYSGSASNDAFDRIRWVKADLFDVVDVTDLMDGVTAVFHCAAVVSFQPRDARMMLEANPKMTEILVNEALRQKVGSFIHVSSVAALGRSESKEEINEHTEWKDSPLNSTYAKSKYAAELQVWRAMEEGLNVGVVNPAIILGPGPWTSGSSKFFHTFYKGFPFYTGGITGFVDVEDVVESMLRIERQKAFKKRFVLVSENLPYKQIFDKISEAYGRKGPSLQPPRWMMGLLWRMEWLRSLIFGVNPLVTKETVRSARSVHRYSNRRVREDLGIDFRPVDETIRRYAALYLEEVKRN